VDRAQFTLSLVGIIAIGGRENTTPY